MTEQVLVVPAGKDFELPSGAIPDLEAVNCLLDIIPIHGRYRDKQEMENDESFKQIIPYCVLVNSQDDVLVYKRTKKGGEGRLHEKFSIGVGGHINPCDSRNVFHCALRELREELNWGGVTPQKMWLRKAGLIYDASNAVGRVHLGVVFLVHVPAHVKELTPADPTVARLEWMALAKLRDFNRFEELESWSQLVIRDILVATPLLREGKI